MPMHPSYFQHMGYLPSSPSPLQDARSAVLNVPPSAVPEVYAHCGVDLSSAPVPLQSNLDLLATSTTILQEALNPDSQHELEV